MHLKSKLNEITKNTNESVHDRFLKIKDIEDELTALGETVKEEQISQVVLKGVKKEYNHFVTSIAVRENFPSLEDFKALLIQEEETFKEDMPSYNKQESALAMVRGGRAVTKRKTWKRKSSPFQQQLKISKPR